MSHFNRRNIFDVSCKVRSARPRDNIEKVCRRLLVKDLIKISNINNYKKSINNKNNNNDNNNNDDNTDGCWSVL